MRKLIPVLLIVIHCKTPDGVYRQSPPPENGDAAEFQIVEYGGRLFAQHNKRGLLIQVENIGELQNFKNDSEDKRVARDGQVGFPRLEIKGDQVHILNPQQGEGTTYQKDPQRSEIFVNLKQGLSFVPFGRPETRDFRRVELRGPFLHVTNDKGECYRYVLFAEPAGKRPHEKRMLRAVNGRGDFPTDCNTGLTHGFTYDISDNAFGFLLIPDDVGKIAGAVVVGYMYGRVYIASGYPPQKATKILKRAMGTADEAYE